MVLAMLLGARTPARAVRLQHAPVALAEGWSQPAFSTVFSESLSHGHCVLVKLPQKEQVGEDYRLPSELLPEGPRRPMPPAATTLLAARWCSHWIGRPPRGRRRRLTWRFAERRCSS